MPVSHLHAAPLRTAAAAMRAIGTRQPHDHLCACCSVTWNGTERDCWACGLPATAHYTHPGAALQRLLISATHHHTLTRRQVR
ncbi:hypothetical protein [Streptomyces sp. NPDC093097]|uniref:hypothetical protein n=1 Tax=Streptomyces sp. NPDC093097 TaxID=3366027 RepID=UPI00381292E9